MSPSVREKKPQNHRSKTECFKGAVIMLEELVTWGPKHWVDIKSNHSKDLEVAETWSKRKNFQLHPV